MGSTCSNGRGQGCPFLLSYHDGINDGKMLFRIHNRKIRLTTPNKGQRAYVEPWDNARSSRSMVSRYEIVHLSHQIGNSSRSMA